MARKIMHALKLNEISAVDRPAQSHAKSVIMKRADDPAELGKRFFSADARRADAKDGSAMPDGSFPIKNETDLRNAERLAGHAKDPAAARAHIRARAKALGLTTHMSKSEMEKAKMDAILKALGLADTATEADVVAKIAKMSSTDELSKMKIELGIAKAGFSAEELAFYKDSADGDDDGEEGRDGLDDSKRKTKKGFRLATKAQRAEVLKAAAPALPAEIVKALADAEALRKRVAELEGKDELVALNKRAVEHDLPEAEGETIQKAYRGDKAAVDKLLGFIKQANAAARSAGVFKEFGSTRNDNTNATAYEKLKTKAAELKKADPKLTEAAAFAKVYEDPANADLVKQERGENRPSAA